MRIDFVRTGGFAGVRLGISLDTDDLEHETASELEALVQDAGFFDIASGQRRQAGGADRFQYRLRISSSTGVDHQVVMQEPAVPRQLLPLLTRLTTLALDQQKRPEPPEKTA